VALDACSVYLVGASWDGGDIHGGLRGQFDSKSRVKRLICRVH
jgi:hypothetical protein